MRRAAALALAAPLLAGLALAGCQAPGRAPARDGERAGPFPAPDRPVARIVSTRWSTEEARDRVSEADSVMDRAGVVPGMTVADIGAGEGYYTVRLATRVGADGRVLAQDIVPEVRDALAQRVNRERLDNVSVKLGEPENPKLPAGSFDRVFMVHMYHEIGQPYAFLWHLRPALRPGGRVIVVDSDRPTQNHGTPPALLACEFAALGYRQVAFAPMPRADSYFAAFEAHGPRPEPRAVRACRYNRPSR
ncbi:methyltransferase domain-containing protein [Sphingomonas changnyeongensis]|uniref:Methyltransferase domain-containing protein n=1 Tax=Sphingomonas changnyeongensis TaxID=2698679 RepID=A0A7Z2S8C6_9SPHN|nr:methyltransferase domain-containing protein [Sphingomonas changnyeongensis]QHL89669.1 methyltransferase domain-containing protein [Sphingomonas changnyeongensis]